MKKTLTVLLLVLACLFFFAACNDDTAGKLFDNVIGGFKGEISTPEDFLAWTDYGGDACLTKDLTLYDSYELVPGKGGSDFNLNLKGHTLTFGDPADLSKDLEPLKKAKKASLAKVTVVSTVKLKIESVNDSGVKETAKIEVKQDTSADKPDKQGTLIQNEGGTVGLEGVDVGNEGGEAPMFVNTGNGTLDIKDSILTSSPTDGTSASDLIMTDSGEVNLDNVDTDKPSNEPLIKTVNDVEQMLTSGTDAEEPAYGEKPVVKLVDSFRKTTPSDLIGGKNEPEVKASVSATITVTPTSLRIVEGETATITAEVTPTDDWTLLWTVSGNEVTSVSKDGVVTALKGGKDTVRVTIDGKPNVYAECEVTVIPLTREIGLEKTSLALAPKAFEKLTVILTPSDAEPELVWTVSGDGATTITDDGTVTAVTTGTDVVTVTVSGTDLSASCTVTVDYLTVSFDMGGHGTQVATKTDVSYGDIVTRPTTPTETNWTFVDWYTTDDYSTEYDFSAPVTEDTIIYAKWSESRIVSFEMNGHGTTPSDMTVAKNAKITGLTSPTETGYEFEGWFKEATCDTAWDFANDTVAEDTTLYAKWEAQYKVSFNVQGHGSTPSDLYVLEDSKISEPAKLSLPIGQSLWYVFGGWYTDTSCTDLNKWDFSVNTVKKDTTLYAKWTISVIGVLNTADNLSKTSPWINITEKNGYVLAFFDDNLWMYSSLTDLQNNPDFGQSASFISYGSAVVGEFISPSDYQCVSYGTTYTFTLTEGKVTKIKIENWGTGYDGEYALTLPGSTVSFDMNGKTGTAPQTQTVEIGGKATTPTDPKVEGWAVDGWYKEQACTNAWDFNTDTVTKDTTLYAKWVQTFKVTFDSNGKNNPHPLPAVQVVKNGQCAQQPIPVSINGENQHTFICYEWYTDTSCTDKWNFASDTIEKDTTLYAKWNITVIGIIRTAETVPSKDTPWVNENGYKFCMTSDYKGINIFTDVEDSTKINASYNISLNYIYQNTGYHYGNEPTYKDSETQYRYKPSGSNATYTFTLTNGKLTKIEVEGINRSGDTEYNGTYQLASK